MLEMPVIMVVVGIPPGAPVATGERDLRLIAVGDASGDHYGDALHVIPAGDVPLCE